MNTWQTKAPEIIEILAATDKGIGIEELAEIRKRFSSWADFVRYLGNLPDANKEKTMYLFFDTETTGLPKNWKAPVSDLDNWPRLVQLAWLAYDKNEKLITGASHIIKPVGFEIPERASCIHGITTEKATSIGESLPMVLNVLHHQISMAGVIVGHNIEFDCNIVGAEFLRNKLPRITPARRRICTMLGSKDYCALPRNKWPKLTELHQKLFNSDFEGAHDAGDDIAATAKCFWALKQKGIIRI